MCAVAGEVCGHDASVQPGGHEQHRRSSERNRGRAPLYDGARPVPHRGHACTSAFVRGAIASVDNYDANVQRREDLSRLEVSAVN